MTVSSEQSAGGRVTLEYDGAVACLTLSNPPQGYMDEAMETALAAHVDALEADDAIRAVVLTGGQDGVFVRHYDVSVIETRGRALAARGLRLSTDRPVPEAPIHATLRRMEQSGKAYVAALNGTAMGGGFELALACDIRLVQNGAHHLGLPEINLGILPGAGGTQRLPRLIGHAWATRMMLLGDTLTPREAVSCGFAMTLTDGPVLPDAMTVANRLAAKPAKALAHIKRLLRSAGDTPLDEALAAERMLFCDLMISDDAIALMADWTDGKRTIRDDP